MAPDLSFMIATLQKISNREEMLAADVFDSRTVDKIFSADATDDPPIPGFRPSSIKKLSDYFNNRYPENIIYFRLLDQLGDEGKDQTELNKYVGGYRLFRRLPKNGCIDESSLKISEKNGTYAFEHRSHGASVSAHKGYCFFLLNRIHFMGIGYSYIRSMDVHEAGNLKTEFMHGLLTTIAKRDYRLFSSRVLLCHESNSNFCKPVQDIHEGNLADEFTHERDEIGILYA